MTDWSEYPNEMKVAQERRVEALRIAGEVLVHLIEEKLMVDDIEAFLASHESTLDDATDGGSGTTQPDGHPED